MRLLILSPYYPPHIGGLESHSAEFNRHMVSSVDGILVLTPHLPRSTPTHEIDDKITILRFPAFELIHNYPLPQFWRPVFWRLWREAKRWKPTHVISRTRFFFTSLMAWRIARSTRLPWLHIEHGSDFAHFHSPIKTWAGRLYDQTVGRFVLRQAGRVVANSEAAAHFVERLSGRQDCRTIYRGVEVETILRVPAGTEIRARFPNRVVVGYLGRLIDGKGTIHILEALHRLQDPRLVCAIIGSGPDRSRLEAYIRQHTLNEKVMLLGHRPLPEALGLLKTCDIFINPSYSEGIPTSVIEAALMQKAIIATDVGGTREIIGGQGDGFLVPAGNIQILAEKIKRLADDPVLRQQYGERAALSVKDKFAWSKAVEQYLTILGQMQQPNINR